MYFRDIFGLEEVKRTLIHAVEHNHVAHAQLFAGEEGSANLALALAFARYIHCENKGEYDSCGTCASCSKMDKLVHPDLHFVMPASSTTKISKPLSQDFLKEWRDFALNQPYNTITDWLALIGAESKTPSISAEESRKIVSTLSLMPFESENKILLIWLPEYFNITSANALLKALEEPPAQTLFFLVSEKPEKMLITILSRLQRIRVRPFHDEEVSSFLEQKYQIDSPKAKQIAHLAEGNMHKALTLMQEVEDDNHTLFRDWMRLCYQRDYKGIYSNTEEFGKMSKEGQRNLLQYGLNMCREALVWKYGGESLVRLDNHSMQFVQGFSKTIGEHNIQRFYQILNDAMLHLDRNANAKIVFFDTSLQISGVIK
ncbi:MAG: DNA polymerase III subunit delta [Raineya sp.]|jgi:DNA polymerase-3 subunit delta'|nr:DNA polymerase III subunit delta [Raineya sp.]